MIPSRNDGKRCVFVREWDCSVETDEIPMGICQLCLEARKIHAMEAKRLRNGKTVEPPLSLKELQKLDHLYRSGEIGSEEYVQERRRIVNLLLAEPIPSRD